MGYNNMFYIRVDANTEIATGHVIRCLTIADEIQRRGREIVFITADHCADELIHSRGFESICLNSKWNDLSSEIPIIIKLIKSRKISEILIDSYFVTYKYLQWLCQYIKVIYLDDLGKINYPIDVLVNYNIYAHEISYKKLIGFNNTKFLLGEKYTPLRREFYNIQRSYRDSLKAVLISTGGADKYNIAENIIKNILKESYFSNIQFYVISGSLNHNRLSLVELSRQNRNIHICENISIISELMCRCDIAISACGTTMYELCACGLPVITFSFADNQIPGANGFAKKMLAFNCGDYRYDTKKTIYNIKNNLKKLIYNSSLRKEMYENARKLVDGKGAIRIVDEIM